MGHWQEISISYRDAGGHYCDCCGKQVARHLYVTSVADAPHSFCGPDCAELYQWYWLPRYGKGRGRQGEGG